MSKPRIITVTFDENGDATYLASEGTDIFLELGETVTHRASHVEPATRGARLLFHFLRLFGNKNRIAEWTRHWDCNWRVNTAPVGGPILTYADVEPRYRGTAIGSRIATWHNRQDAIDTEIAFLNQFFLEGC